MKEDKRNENEVTILLLKSLITKVKKKKLQEILTRCLIDITKLELSNKDN